MKLVPLLLLAGACLSAPQGPAQTAVFDGARALEHIKQLVAIGPRVAGTPGAQKTRDYISKHITALGLKVEEQPFDARTPLGVAKMVNLRVTIPGTNASAPRIIVAGHYDTKRFEEFSFVGANDAGSSTAFLIELARVLKDSWKGASAIELLWLDGEEAVLEWVNQDHTYGSRHYVQTARADGTLKSIKALVLVDMVGDRDLRIQRESNSTPWLTDIIWAQAQKLGRREFLNASTPIEDDHIEFLRAGVPAVDIIDLDYGPGASWWHTPQDTLDKLSPASLQAVGDVVVAALPAIDKR